MIPACKFKNDTETVNGGWLLITFITEEVRTPFDSPGNVFKRNTRVFFHPNVGQTSVRIDIT